MSNARDIADAGHQLVAWVNFNGTFNDASGGQAPNASYACSGSTITITDTAHGLTVGDSIHAVFTRSAGDTTTITDDFFTVLTVPSVDTFTIQTVVATTDQSGSVAYDSDAATATAGSGPIRASYNVASITNNGTGDYTINFATAMPDDKYSVVCSGSMESSNVRRGSSVGPRGSDSFDNAVNSLSSGSVRILSAIYGTSYLNPALLDLDIISVTIFR